MEHKALESRINYTKEELMGYTKEQLSDLILLQCSLAERVDSLSSQNSDLAEEKDALSKKLGQAPTPEQIRAKDLKIAELNTKIAELTPSAEQARLLQSSAVLSKVLSAYVDGANNFMKTVQGALENSAMLLDMTLAPIRASQNQNKN